jgi:hypothetical protein
MLMKSINLEFVLTSSIKQFGRNNILFLKELFYVQNLTILSCNLCPIKQYIAIPRVLNTFKPIFYQSSKVVPFLFRLFLEFTYIKAIFIGFLPIFVIDDIIKF